MGIFNLFNKNESWVFLGTTTVDPQIISPEIIGKLDKETLEKIMFGYTTYIWQNEQNGEVRKDSYLGTDETPLKALLAKVDMWGKYEVLMDNKKYIITKIPENHVLPVVESVSPIINNDTPIDIKNLPVR